MTESSSFPGVISILDSSILLMHVSLGPAMNDVLPFLCKMKNFASRFGNLGISKMENL